MSMQQQYVAYALLFMYTYTHKKSFDIDFLSIANMEDVEGFKNKRSLYRKIF